MMEMLDQDKRRSERTRILERTLLSLIRTWKRSFKMNEEMNLLGYWDIFLGLIHRSKHSFRTKN